MRSHFCSLLALGLVLTAGIASAETIAEKCKPLKIIIPQAPGSASDYIARSYAKAITDVSGANVIIDNKPGADGVIGLNAAKSAPPDGCTMLLASSSATVLNVIMIPKLSYDPFTDLIPLATVNKASILMTLGTSTTYKSAKEFIDAARVAPGKYTMASSTSTTRLAGQLFQAISKTKLLDVPYKASSGGITALASGEVDTYFIDVASALPMMKSGRIRAVAVTSGTRSKLFPNLPTLQEEGLPGYNVSAWFATYYPAKTPPELVAAMREITHKAAKNTRYLESLEPAGMEPFELVGDEVTSYARKELEIWKGVVQAATPKP